MWPPTLIWIHRVILAFWPILNLRGITVSFEHIWLDAHALGDIGTGVVDADIAFVADESKEAGVALEEPAGFKANLGSRYLILLLRAAQVLSGPVYDRCG